MPAPDYKTTHPKNRKQWRQWLEKNHQTSPGVWFIYYKKETGKPRVSYEAAVEEALCFGWIDSLPRKLDEERTMLKFTPRKPKSVWSKLNKTRIEKLSKEKVLHRSNWQKKTEVGIHLLPPTMQLKIMNCLLTLKIHYRKKERLKKIF